MDTVKKKPVKLTKEHWQEVRTRWENDPRDGYAWLVTEFSLSVTSKAILMKAKREGWVKLVTPKKVAEQAHRKADSHYKVDSVTQSVTLVTQEGENLVTAVTNQEANEIAIDLRTAIIQGHRDDAKNFRDVDLQLMGTMEGARIAKIKIDAIKVLHDIERRAWMLDVMQESQDDAVDTSVLDKLFAEKMEKMARDREVFENRVI